MSFLLTAILLPTVAGIAAYFIPGNRPRRWLWITTAVIHFCLSVYLAFGQHYSPNEHWIGMDPLSAVFLPLTGLLFLMISIYGAAYVSREPAEQRPDSDTGGLLNNVPESVFTGCLLLFLASMSLAILSQHFGLQWMAIEATTLASAPLIYYHRNRRSLEAAWKYLILCSVGIAIALMGIFFIGLAVGPGSGDLTLSTLMAKAGHLDHKWLGLAFILMLVGYGTKMGLAPMHNWLPEAHSEAPSPVSALLSAALLNCAFIGILRILQICSAAGIGSFGRDLLLLFGLVSMGTASVFLLGQVDFKRMLAYSSVEHMGILALGAGLGGLGVFGALLHAVNHSLTKAMLFMTAGNIHSRYHSKDSTVIRGLLQSMPGTGALWLVGWLAIVGSPPFGTFMSEFIILRTGIANGQWLPVALYALFLILAFIGISNVVLRMAFGTSPAPRRRESRRLVLPALILGILVLCMGVFLPYSLDMTLHKAAALVSGGNR